MKNRLLMFVACLGFLLLLTACKGSKQIQGTWQAQDSAGKNVTITISKNTIKIGEESFDYTQNVVGIKNSIQYYGLKIKKKCIRLFFLQNKKMLLCYLNQIQRIIIF